MNKFITLILAALFLTPLVRAETTDSGCEHPFIDILDHWAEEEICFLYSQNDIEGHSGRNFLPDEDITRAEFLKISLLNLGYTVYAAQDFEFIDVAPGDWYYQYVTFAKSKGFVTGYSDGSFHPNPVNVFFEIKRRIINRLFVFVEVANQRFDSSIKVKMELPAASFI